MRSIRESPCIPVRFSIDTSVFKEVQWRAVREECVKLGCKRWKFDDEGNPCFPCKKGCECREYLELYGWGWDKDKK